MIVVLAKVDIIFSDKKSVIYNNINNYTYGGYIQNLFSLNNDLFDKTLFSIILVKSNTKVIDSEINDLKHLKVSSILNYGSIPTVLSLWLPKTFYDFNFCCKF